MDSVMTWIESNKAICWAIFWVGWFFLSQTTIIPGAVAVGVGNVIYKERDKVLAGADDLCSSKADSGRTATEFEHVITELQFSGVGIAWATAAPRASMYSA